MKPVSGGYVGMWLGVVAIVAFVWVLAWAVPALAVDPFPDQIWWQSYHGGFGNDDGSGVAIDSQKNVVLVGSRGSEPPWATRPQGQGMDAYLRRYSSAGDLLCEREEKGPGLPLYPADPREVNDSFSGVVVDSQDNIIAAGSLSGDYWNNGGYFVAGYLNKYDTDCSPVWAAPVIYKYPGDSAWQGFYSVALDQNGNIYPTGGVFGGWGGPEHEWATFKYDTDGALQPGFPILYNYSPSASYVDRSYDVAVDSHGNMIVVGIRGVWVDNAAYDWHVRKYDPAGALIWADTYSGAVNLHDFAYRVAVDSEDNPIVVGYTNKGTNNAAGANYDWLVIKYKADSASAVGERLWTKTYESAAGQSELAYAVAVDADNNAIVAGTKRVDASTSYLRLALLEDTSGTEIGERIVTEPPNVTPMRLAYRADSIAIGGYVSNASAPYNDMYVALLSFPDVLASVPADPNPTNLASVNFTVTFTSVVTGVDAADFVLTTAGLAGAAVTGVSGSGKTWTVAVDTGTGNGTLRLDVIDDDTIVDAADYPLGGIGAGNGNFTDGESYTVTKIVTLTLKSVGANDGWILETSETSGQGGTLNATTTTFSLGDDAANRQYLGFLHFDTASLPDTAVVISATLGIKQQGLVGTSPFATHGKLLADIRKGFFGTTVKLALNDFQAVASKVAVVKFGGTAINKWYSAAVSGKGLTSINRTGPTQFRLRFSMDDNNDLGENSMRFYSGSASAAARPQLIIQYYVP